MQKKPSYHEFLLHVENSLCGEMEREKVGGSCSGRTVIWLCEGSSCCSHGSQLICRRLTEPSPGPFSPGNDRGGSRAALPSGAFKGNKMDAAVFWWVDQRCLISISGSS